MAQYRRIKGSTPKSSIEDKIKQYLNWKVSYAEILLGYEGKKREQRRPNLFKKIKNKYFLTPKQFDNTENGITIVIPIYADWKSVSRCIESVIRYFNISEGNRVLLMNDNGPEADDIEKRLLRAIRAKKGFYYHRNERNLGFIRNCNRAVDEIDQTSNEILLLNSDARLTNHAIEEMQRVLYRNGNIASVTPRSNNATVFSVPFEAAFNNEYSSTRSFEQYCLVKNKLPDVYETPTGHGFCLLVRRSVIKKHGLFDTVFGRGYCEENDFCMRVRRNGYTHAVANKAYVFHEGSKSFTSKGRDEQIGVNHKILTERYPEYDYLVARYIYDEVLNEQPYYFTL